MAIRRIVIYGAPVLRQKAAPISEVDDSVRTLAEDMIETMFAAEGIGLAAPQVGESVALCVVNMGLIVDQAEPKAFVNPEILSSDGSVSMEEGCLSIPDIREDVTRPERIVVRYTDLGGVTREEACDGMLARVLQHEIDHLNGVLFIDRISPVKRKLLAKRLKKLAAEAHTEVSARGL